MTKYQPENIQSNSLQEDERRAEIDEIMRDIERMNQEIQDTQRENAKVSAEISKNMEELIQRLMNLPPDAVLPESFAASFDTLEKMDALQDQLLACLEEPSSEEKEAKLEALEQRLNKLCHVLVGASAS